jgi:cell division septal protein FtsQ
MIKYHIQLQTKHFIKVNLKNGNLKKGLQKFLKIYKQLQNDSYDIFLIIIYAIIHPI